MISLRCLQKYSIDFSYNQFIYNVAKQLKFHNHILTNDKIKINKYICCVINTFKTVKKWEFNEIEKIIEKINNTDIIDSNHNLELFIVLMKKYGFSERYIIKKMLRGENFIGIEFFNKNSIPKDFIPLFINNKNHSILFKLPLQIEEDNKTRIIFIAQINKENETTIFPIAFDFHHYLFSKNNFTINNNKNKKFEKII